MLPPHVSSSSSSTSASLSTATTSSKRQRANFAAPPLSSSTSASLSLSSLSSRVSSAVIPASRLLQMPRSILEECIGGFLETNEVFQMRYACRQLHGLRFHLYGSCRVPVTEEGNVSAVVSKYRIHSLYLDIPYNLRDSLMNSNAVGCFEYYNRLSSPVLLAFPPSGLRQLRVFSLPPVGSDFKLSYLQVLEMENCIIDSRSETPNFFIGCQFVTRLCIDNFIYPADYSGESYLRMFNQLTFLSLKGLIPDRDTIKHLLGKSSPPLEVLNIPRCQVPISWICSLSSLTELHVEACVDDVSEENTASAKKVPIASLSSSTISSRSCIFESAALPQLKVLTINKCNLLGLLNGWHVKRKIVAPRCTTLTTLNIDEYVGSQLVPFDCSNCTNLTSISVGFAKEMFDVGAQYDALLKFLKPVAPFLRKLGINYWDEEFLSLPLPQLTELSIAWCRKKVYKTIPNFETECLKIARVSFYQFSYKILFQFSSALTHLSLLNSKDLTDEFFNTLSARAPGLKSLEITYNHAPFFVEEPTILGPYRLPIQHPTLTCLCFKERWSFRQEATFIFRQRTDSGRSYLIKGPDDESSSVCVGKKTSAERYPWMSFIIDPS